MSYPVENFENKLIIEGTPGFNASMYRHIRPDGTINYRALSKQVKDQDLSPQPHDGIIFNPPKPTQHPAQ